jgi:hypothetical protein
MNQLYTVTYSQQILASSPEEAALKATGFLTEDLSQRYTELTLTVTSDRSVTGLPKPHPGIDISHIMIGITKDPRGRRTFTVNPDDECDQK